MLRSSLLSPPPPSASPWFLTLWKVKSEERPKTSRKWRGAKNGQNSTCGQKRTSLNMPKTHRDTPLHSLHTNRSSLQCGGHTQPHLTLVQNRDPAGRQGRIVQLHRHACSHASAHQERFSASLGLGELRCEVSDFRGPSASNQARSIRANPLLGPLPLCPCQTISCNRSSSWVPIASQCKHQRQPQERPDPCCRPALITPLLSLSNGNRLLPSTPVRPQTARWPQELTGRLHP